MNEEVFHKSVGKFLKKVGVTSQQQIEKAVQDAVNSGKLKGDETIAVKVLLTSEILDQPFEVDGTLKLA